MKKWSLLIAVMLLFGLTATVYAGELPSSYDFEGYTAGIPAGWSGTQSSYWKGVTVDEEHGTSLELHNIGSGTRPEPYYSFPTVNSGRFLLSFEINWKTANRNNRITLYSPSSGKNYHSIFQMDTAKQMNAWMNTADSAWDPKKMINFELDTWYKVDILINMDTKLIEYYVDEVYQTSSTVGFDDFSQITFRTEGATADVEGYYYLDNVTFKYLTAEGMNVYLENENVDAGTDTIEVNFSDTITINTLNQLKAYSMGTNPVEYKKESIDCQLVSSDTSKAVIKFSEGLDKNTIYKIEFPGLTSLYGDEFKYNSVYFATSGAMADKKVVNADFSKTEIGGAIAPTTDEEWTASNTSYVGIEVVNDLDDEGSDINAVSFARRSGSSTLSLKRDFTNAYTDRIVLKYKMKSEAPMQLFRVYDSQDEVIDLVTVKTDGIYYAENKLSDYITDWFTVSVELKQAERKVAFSINDGESVEYDYDGIEDVKTIEFFQQNAEGATGNNRAKTYIAYCTVSALAPSVSANLVMFEDSEGNVYYSDDTIPAKISKIYVKFSDSVRDDSSLEDGIKLTSEDFDEEFTGDYDTIKKQYVMTLPQYLQGSCDYTLNVEGVYDSAGTEVAPVCGTFTTASGVYECDALALDVEGQSVAISTEITHTDNSYDDMYLVYAAYQGDFMVDFEAAEIVPDDGQRKISVLKTYTAPAEADTVRAFLWDGFNTRIPVKKALSVSNNE